MILTDLLEQLKKVEVTLTVEENGVVLRGDDVTDTITEQVRQALPEVQQELKDYPKCIICNRVDVDYKHDGENAYCIIHYKFENCIVCGKREALTSIVPCLECQVRRLVQ